MRRSHIALSREQILSFRRYVSHLASRLPYRSESLKQAAWAGLQDSMPRAALLSIYARVEGTTSGSWQDPNYVQVWGPRFSAYVIAADDLAIFTLSRLPEISEKRAICLSLANRLRNLLDGESMPAAEAAKALGEHHNQIRRATSTGTLLIHWDGAHQPTIRSVPQPDMEPAEARIEMARRYLHVFGPATSDAFAGWAGIPKSVGHRTFESLEKELARALTPIGEAMLLESDVETATADPDGEPAVRLLPSGDTYYLTHGESRDLILGDSSLQALLWTSRVWSGALLVDGEIVGTWRRAGNTVTIEPWAELTTSRQQEVEAEATGLPIPDLGREIEIEWIER